MAQTAVKAGGERLATLALPESGAWLAAARKAAQARLLAMGLPGRRDEYWKYTNPTSLTDAAVTSAAAFDDPSEAP
ncbi:MAG: Fe-S cluster assembly protein SufD, partial [Paracoccaceae bacterium]|nr:Fe-S cluster assembly protein SufD [Paracoccaceae bacterium]